MEHPLRTFRKRKGVGLTLDTLADRTGISKATLSRIETGDQRPSFDVIRTLIAFSRGFEEPALTAEDFVFASERSPTPTAEAVPQ